jgi:hypothetical protein
VAEKDKKLYTTAKINEIKKRDLYDNWKKLITTNKESKKITR